MHTWFYVIKTCCQRKHQVMSRLLPSVVFLCKVGVISISTHQSMFWDDIGQNGLRHTARTREKQMRRDIDRINNK